MESSVQTISSPVYKRKDWRVWWRLTRPHTLTAAFVPVTLGTVLAMSNGTTIHITLFLMMMIASILIQIATNLFNEYYDYKRGLDHAESVGIGGGIVRDGLQPKTIMKLAFSLYGVSLLIGIYICMNSSWWLAAVGLGCMAVGYLYTGGPKPIAYTPFGELASGLMMGMIIVLISFFIQTGTVTVASILIATPIMILVGSINLSNNIRDLDGDKENGRRTLAILLGKKNAVIFLASMFTLSYIWVFALVAFGIISPWIMLVVLSIPKAVTAIKGFMKHTAPLQMMPAMKATSQTNTFFGLLLSFGIFIGHFI
ncbi:1,4-dihydroxy-2-naphthoate polyprenyltransferase [Bacillus sp. V3B]|uniref:1,4-dihydroxy-2-naphthoate polyprenyltransferase n=1 Tax=Bacillus sp. V3B TaxID=2804915 RepID=UPI00210AA567|nr:1,4-dihydroxy-2-naphthoate polyprenyltransferase [Bacillus sp. V3B]MCQ6274480.1 1,4-dihydroxy-2-naphthoate polyprenyltransferase [Bacillus sp. V3B]